MIPEPALTVTPAKAAQNLIGQRVPL